MKILFFISVHGHGKGGHFHSLNHISQKLGEQHDVKIISIGPGRSKIIESNPYFLQHISFKGFNFFKLIKFFKKEIRLFNPDIFHCFDTGSYNIVRLLVSSRKNKIFLNKCGGPNPKKFPRVDNLVLFSAENMAWFRSQAKYKNSNIDLIPNRINPLKVNPNFQPITKTTDDFIFLRICRIGHTYKKSIDDSINLVSRLFSKKIKLFIIGTVEGKEIFEDFQKNEFVKNGVVRFLTSPEFTTEASKMLYLADAVIGTGRGIMEAASLGKPLLSINKEGNIPVLLNSKYFNDAFYTNFSERNGFKNYNPEENLDNIIKLIQDKEYYRKISSYSLKCFNHYFDLNNVSQSYPNAYSQARKGKRNLILDSPLILRSLLNFYRGYQNPK